MDQSSMIYGDVTRELHRVFSEFADDGRLPVDRVRASFQAMHLYPTKSQVYEMMECASQCSFTTVSSKTRHDNEVQAKSRQSHVTELRRSYLTLGEFCVFASQLRKQYGMCCSQPVLMSKVKVYEKKYLDKKRKSRAGSFKSYEVFLGGSCNPTTWRLDIVIPVLKQHGITYYNPQVTDWVPEMIELEDQAKQAAQLLFFVIDNQTRSVASMVESAYLIGCGRQVVLIIKPWPHDEANYVMGERISEKECESLSRGQAFLHDLSESSCTPVFESTHTALSCAVTVVQRHLKVQDLTLLDAAVPVRNPHLHVGDKLLSLREAFDSTRSSEVDYLSESDLRLACRSVSVEDLPESLQNTKKQEFSFEHFCCIVAECKSRKDIAKKIRQFLTTYLITPLLFLLTFILMPIKDWITSFSMVQLVMNYLHLLLIHITPNTSQTRDIYLGGNLDGAWRDEKAIPLLWKHGVTYYNAEQCIWTNRLIPLESVSKYHSKLLLFVISNKSRALAAMTEAAYYIGQGCDVVLCVQHLSQDVELDGEMLSRQAVKDYNRGRTYLSDIANREGVPVFEDVEEAVMCAVNKIKSGAHAHQRQKPKIF